MKTLIFGLILSLSAFANAYSSHGISFSIIGKTQVSLKVNHFFLGMKYSDSDEKITAYITQKGSLLLLEDSRYGGGFDGWYNLQVFQMEKDANGNIVMGQKLYDQKGVLLDSDVISQLEAAAEDCPTQAEIKSSPYSRDYLATETTCVR